MKKLLPAIAVLLILTGCASRISHTEVYQHLNHSDYSQALATLEDHHDDFYGSTDEVLYLLDTGVMAHYDKKYQESNAKLSAAERLIEEYYAVSIGQSVSSWLLNDLVKDYDGDDYEDIYTNLFMALNYIQMGMIEDAFVEIRRFDNKQKLLLTKYGDAIGYANQQLADKDAQSYRQSSQFSNSALARYLSMILYRSTGQLDNAAVDRKYITQAFETQQALYDFPEPTDVLDEELTVPKGMARLNIMSFTGMAPVKFEEKVRLYNRRNDFYYTVAFPVMSKRPSATAGVRVCITSENGTTVTVPLNKIESIENIAEDTFSQKQSLIYARAVVRSIGKAMTSSTLSQFGESSAGLSILALASKVAQDLTETADIRTSQYFPGSVYVTGVTLEPGMYSVTVEYLNSRNAVYRTETMPDVTVRAKGINLVESLCLQ